MVGWLSFLFGMPLESRVLSSAPSFWYNSRCVKCSNVDLLSVLLLWVVFCGALRLLCMVLFH